MHEIKSTNFCFLIFSASRSSGVRSGSSASSSAFLAFQENNIIDKFRAELDLLWGETNHTGATMFRNTEIQRQFMFTATSSITDIKHQLEMVGDVIGGIKTLQFSAPLICSLGNT